MSGARHGVSTAVIVLGWLLVLVGISGLVLLLTPPMWFVLIILTPNWGAFALALSPFAALATGVLLVGAGRRMARERRLPGFCRRCGYDLRGSASSRCPECGAVK